MSAECTESSAPAAESFTLRCYMCVGERPPAAAAAFGSAPRRANGSFMALIGLCREHETRWFAAMSRMGPDFGAWRWFRSVAEMPVAMRALTPQDEAATVAASALEFARLGHYQPLENLHVAGERKSEQNYEDPGGEVDNVVQG